MLAKCFVINMLAECVVSVSSNAEQAQLYSCPFMVCIVQGLLIRQLMLVIFVTWHTHAVSLTCLVLHLLSLFSSLFLSTYDPDEDTKDSSVCISPFSLDVASSKTKLKAK